MGIPEEEEGNAEIPEYESPDWADIVERIRNGDDDAMVRLYHFFGKGVRWFFYRALGSEDLDDRVHDCFLVVAQAIRNGDLREPDRLMGFVRTIVRRQIATVIEEVSERRASEREYSESIFHVADWKENPEKSLVRRQRIALGRKVLREISAKDREVLERFYVQEQDHETICAEMGLSYNQFRLLKNRAKARFGKLGRKLSLLGKGALDTESD